MITDSSKKRRSLVRVEHDTIMVRRLGRCPMTQSELLDEAHELANAVASTLVIYRQYDGYSKILPLRDGDQYHWCRPWGVLANLQIRAERLCEQIERTLPDEDPDEPRTNTVGFGIEYA